MFVLPPYFIALESTQFSFGIPESFFLFVLPPLELFIALESTELTCVFRTVFIFVLPPRGISHCTEINKIYMCFP